MADKHNPYIRWFEEVGRDQVAEVGGKNSSIGEMIRKLVPSGINVPGGFATTSEAFWTFLRHNNLLDPIQYQLKKLEKGETSLPETGREIRKMINNGLFPISLAESIRKAYHQLSEQYEVENADVAVRSSATAEDLPRASFAGLQHTFLNIRGETELLNACKKCFASLYTDRAISYRNEKGFDHMKVALSAGIQKMVRADTSCSGVMFTVDTETGFPGTILINGGWGLGENIVKGIINPDQFTVFKPLLGKRDINPILDKRLGSKELKMVYTSDDETPTKNVNTTPAEQRQFVLNDEEILTLAKWGKIIEDHYGSPMDIEWVKDQDSDKLFIVQARPETVHSAGATDTFKSYTVQGDEEKVLLKGLSIGGAVSHGTVFKADHISELDSMPEGAILVTQMTEPDWVPALKKTAGIITDFGGRTCHAAIVSRELGIPAVVGTSNGTSVLKDGTKITLSCAEGDQGIIYEGHIKFDVEEISPGKLPEVKTKIMLNLATPESAFNWWRLPVDGVGLARMEFIISNHIKVHPMALIRFDRVNSESDRNFIRKITRNYENKQEFFVERLSRGIAKIAASQYPDPVIVRTSDFKTNEYAGLIGGNVFEPDEENPMLGWRGASRYYSEGYREGFALECRALKRVRENMGLENVVVMIPFCRTIMEAEKVLQEMERNGLKRGEHNLKIYMMCEIPSNVILAGEFARYFDGFSIGSNDLTQLILGVDRDSSELAYLFDENNAAVKQAISDVIKRAHKSGCEVGFCGQAPSDDPAYAKFLVKAGIDSISLNPDSVVSVIRHVAEVEKENDLQHA